MKLLIFENAPNEKDLSQLDSALVLMPGKDGVCNNSMKVQKSWVVIKYLGTLLTGYFTPKVLHLQLFMLVVQTPL